MIKLVATYPILYLSKQYEIGDELIANNPEMVNAWLDAGTAKWVEDEESGLNTDKSEEALPPATATPVVAEAGLAGDAVGAETEENLVGKVPKTPARIRK